MYYFIKRTFDVLVASIGIVLTLPIWLPIIIILRLTGEGDVFYFQKRIGYKNQPFTIWKFVTMVRDSPNKLSAELTIRNDPRVTPIGKFLRASKINELPQIINVLNGQMSLVGPRPQTKRDFEVYTREVKRQIYKERPGITGIASIIFRDEEKLLSETKLSVRDYYEQIIAPYKGATELWYVKNRSFLTDAKILFLTAWVIVRPQSQLIYRIFKNLPVNNMEARAKQQQKNKRQKRAPYIQKTRVSKNQSWRLSD